MTNSKAPYPSFEPVGWRCHRCGDIHAPWVPKCNCADPRVIITGATTECACSRRDTGGRVLHEPGCPLTGDDR